MYLRTMNEEDQSVIRLERRKKSKDMQSSLNQREKKLGKDSLSLILSSLMLEKSLLDLFPDS